MSFYHRGLECKSRQSRDTWSNRQVWPWNTNEARLRLTVLPRERTGHNKLSLPTTRESTIHMDITRWSISNQIDYIICSQRLRNYIQSAKTSPGADCGSDHVLLIAKLRLKWKTVRKTTRPIRYDLNQIPYDYTVEMTNRFKGLDLIDRIPEELWMEVRKLYRRQWSRASPRKRNAKRQNGCPRRPYK